MDLQCPCSFCSLGADYAPFKGFALCDRCARRIATVARQANRDEIWFEEQDEGADGQGVADVDHALARLKKSVDADIPSQDAESHANLAEAYRAIGLYRDAVREAATALDAAANARVMNWVLEMLLSAPLIKPGGFGPLRSRVLALLAL